MCEEVGGGQLADRGLEELEHEGSGMGNGAGCVSMRSSLQALLLMLPIRPRADASEDVAASPVLAMGA